LVSRVSASSPEFDIWSLMTLARWCKRPCFHDEYLPAYNSSNVTLVDTKGHGVDKIAASGPEFDG